YAELPGKKIWSWGADADALDWRNALSDDDSAYVEVQSGLFRNQETYAFLQPRQTIRFSEYWIPARDLGGIARANLTGVANLARQGNNLRASFNANSDIPHARIRLLDGARVLLEEHVDLTPAHTWKRQIAILDTCHAYTFELVDAAGALRLRHTEGEYDWTPQDQVHVGPQPAYHMPPAQQRTEDDWLALGEEEERDGKTLLAFSVYQEALQHFSQSFELRKAAGRVAACLLRYEDAVHYLSPLAERDVSDPEIAYYLAFGWENLGDERNARTFYERAYRFPEFRAAASLHLGEMDARAAQLEKAAQRLAISVDAAPSDPRAVEEWTAVQNALGKTDSARRLARQALARDPLSNFVREELGEPDLAHLGADPNRLLYIAAQYMRLGMYRAASRVLSRAYPRSPAQESEPGSVQPQQHVLVAYFNAYCRERLGEPAAQEYERASRLSTLYVFPAGAEALEVLKAAVRNNDSDATAHYLLGTFLFAQGEVNQALVEWQRANKLAPSLPVIDADIGRALLHLKNDPQGALTAFRGGISADSKNTALYTGIDQALSILKHPHTERVQELSRYPDLAHIPSDLLYELILNRAEAGDFEGAVDLFRNRFFPRQEGGTNVRQVWLEVRLQQALSLAKSDHCDAAISAAEQAVDPVSGFAFTNDGVQPLLRAARPQYILGVITERCGRQREARQHFENARQQT
ncbi:MAG: DUF5107 domain-containing protein, partial [Acidobacteriaceae bacterium]|nr:DUF5107 domain-containing protein [Acidobacteriaceae bacterium]